MNHYVLKNGKIILINQLNRQPKILRGTAEHFISDYKEFLKRKQLNDQELKEADEEAKQIYDKIISYANEPPANEYLKEFDDNLPDTKIWNLRLKEYIDEHQKQPNYLDTSLLYSECYIYRTFISPFLKSKYFKDYDAFEKTKRDGLLRSRIAATKLIEFASNISNRIKEKKSTIEEEFEHFTEFALWGNFYTEI